MPNTPYSPTPAQGEAGVTRFACKQYDDATSTIVLVLLVASIRPCLVPLWRSIPQRTRPDFGQLPI